MINIKTYAVTKAAAKDGNYIYYGGSGGGFAGSTSTASKIEPHYLWGQLFDGTQDIDGDFTSTGTVKTKKLIFVNGTGSTLQLDDFKSTSGNIISLSSTTINNSGNFLNGGSIKNKGDFFNDGSIENKGDFFNDGDITNKGDINNLGKITTDQIQAVSGYIETLLGVDWTVENLTVTKAAHFFKLIIDEIKATQGAIIVTPANAKIDKVTNSGNNYVCYFRTTDPTTKKEIYNNFEVNDQVVCQTFNAATGTSYNVSNKFYWTLVYETGTTTVDNVSYHYIKLHYADRDPKSNGVPQAGDEIVLLGNRNDATRQNAIVISAYNSQFLDAGLKAPSIVQYSGINNYNLSSHRLNIISNGLNSFKGIFTTTDGANLEQTYKTISGDVQTNISNISSLSATSKALTSSLKSVENKVETVSGSVTTANNNIATISGNVKTNTTNISNLQQTASSLTSDISSVEKKVKTVSGSVTTANNNIATISGNVKTNTSNISSLQQTASSLTSDISSVEKKVKTVSGSVTTANNNIATISGNVKTNTSNISSLQQTASSLTSDISSVQKQVTTVSGSVTTANGNIATISGNVKTNTSNISSLQQTASSLSSSISSTQTQVKTVSGQVTTLDGTVKTGSGQVVTNTTDISNLKQTSSSLTSSIQSLENDVLKSESLIQQTADNIRLEVMNCGVDIDNQRIRLNGDTLIEGNLTVQGDGVGFTLNGSGGTTQIISDSIGSWNSFSATSLVRQTKSSYSVTNPTTVGGKYQHTMSQWLHFGWVNNGNTVTFNSFDTSLQPSSFSSANNSFTFYIDGTQIGTASYTGIRNSLVNKSFTATKSGNLQVKRTMTLTTTQSGQYNAFLYLTVTYATNAYSKIAYDGMGFNLGNGHHIFCNGTDGVRIGNPNWEQVYTLDGIETYFPQGRSFNDNGTIRTDIATTDENQKSVKFGQKRVRRITSSGILYLQPHDQILKVSTLDDRTKIYLMLGKPSQRKGWNFTLLMGENIYVVADTSGTSNAQKLNAALIHQFYCDGVYWYYQGGPRTLQFDTTNAWAYN